MKNILLSLIIIPTVVISQDELDLDAMWENTVWEEIVNVTDESYDRDWETRIFFI